MSDLHLHIENLRCYFYSRPKSAFIRSVDGVDLSIYRGETVGIVGESGSGKSITMLSVMGLINAYPGVISGRVELNTGQGSRDLVTEVDKYVEVQQEDHFVKKIKKDVHAWNKHVERKMKSIRGGEISMIFQNPKAAMNPFETIGKQISEMIRLHTNINNKKEIEEKALYWLERVKIDAPHIRFNSHPYGLSGGLCQRAMVAMALASESKLLIADEPTTGLDATIQSKIMDLLAEIKQDLGLTIILISHDISVISRLSDKVAVMYGGRIMEYGPASSVLQRTLEHKHPYTAALLDSVPDVENVTDQGYLKAIEGEVLDTINVPKGCRFYSRCQVCHDGIRDKCATEDPGLIAIDREHSIRCWRYGEST